MRSTRDIDDILGPPRKKRGPAPGSSSGGRAANPHRDALYVEQARIARLKADALEGELVPAAEVAAAWAGIIADARAALLAVSSRVGSRLGLPNSTINEVDAEIRRALEALGSVSRVDDG